MKRKPNWKVTVVITVCLAILMGCGIAANGEPGVGIDYIVNNGDGTFTLFLTDESSYTVGNFTGPQGDTGPQGPMGPEGPAGPGFDNVVSATVDLKETTSSAVFTNLSTPGPSVTATITSGKALVILTAYIRPPANGKACMSFVVSGNTSRGESEDYSLMVDFYTGSGDGGIQASFTHLVTGLNNGSNTFTAKYKAFIGTGTFHHRNIIVIPLP